MGWSTRRSRGLRAGHTAGWIVALLAARNVAEARLPADAYVPTNLAVGGALLLLTRRGGVSWDELGLGRRHLGRGLMLGAAVGAVAVAGMVVGAALPATRHLFDDARVPADASHWERVYQTALRIPVGTVAFEELAFRGVLFGVLRQQFSLPSAVALDSALFGLWHIEPTLAAASANGIVGLGRVGLVIGSVLATSVAGIVFCALRLRGRHLLAPALLHLSFNDAGYFLAWSVRS